MTQNTQQQYTDDFLMDMERSWRKSLPHLSFYQYIEIFPTAKAVAARSLKQRIEQCQADLDYAMRFRRWWYKNIINKMSYRSRQFWEEVMEKVYLVRYTDGRESNIKKYKFYLKYLKSLSREGTPPMAQDPERITESDIQRAKDIPVETFITVNSAGFTSCPFHEETHGSFKINTQTNRWHCFGACNEDGDVIDFIIKSQRLTFIEAVKFLIK